MADHPDTPTGRPTIWTRPERGSRGPQPEHSRRDIARAAITLADSGGLAAVSMRAVASRLGTSGGSLYRYVASRGDLLDLMTDEAVGELRLRTRPARQWLEELVAVAHDQLALYRRHPWLADTLVRPDAASGPRAMNFFEHCLRVLEAVDRSTTQKMEALRVVTCIVVLFARSRHPSRNLFSAVTPHDHPRLAAALAEARPGQPDPDLFDRTVRSVLRGLLS